MVLLDDMSKNNNDKHKVSDSSDYNISNTFQNSHILPTYFTSVLAIIGDNSFSVLIWSLYTFVTRIFEYFKCFEDFHLNIQLG